MIRGLLQTQPEFKAELYFDGSRGYGSAAAPGLVQSSKLLDEVRRMVDAFIEHVTWDYIEGDADEEEIFAKLRQYAHLAPSLHWPCHETDWDEDCFVPGIVHNHISYRLGTRRRERKERACEEKRAEKYETRRLAEEAKQQARAEREEKLLKKKKHAEGLLLNGRSIAATARVVGLGETTVSRLAQELGVRPQTNPERMTNDELRSNRIQTCLQAAKLQRSGVSRKEIAQALGVASVESVKALLSDGKFYEDPAAYPERLAATLAAETSPDQSKVGKTRKRDLHVLRELHSAFE